jgi:hypothetical protein
LPGKSLVVYEPTQGLVTDVFPCENGHAQERSLFGPLLKTVAAGDLWIEDRNFCTRDFLCDIDNRGAFFITREHLGLHFKILGPLRPCGRTATGQVAQQRVKVVDQQGHEHVFRRLRIKLNQATRDGATIVHILTNLPRQISAKRVADLYRKRWTLERTFAWLGRNRRHSKDYERRTESSESMLRVSAIHQMLKRLKPSNAYPPFRYRVTG